MKHQLVKLSALFILIILLVNCEEKNSDKFSYTGKGRAHAIKNDTLWNCFANYRNALYVSNDTIIISLFTFDEIGNNREQLLFQDINKNIGKYYLHKKLYNLPYPFINTTASFYIFVQDDVIGKTYDIYEEDTNNFIKITEVDTIKHFIRGEFNAWLGSDSVNIHTLKFTNGWFEVPYP